jgi:hypothetical protein
MLEQIDLALRQTGARIVESVVNFVPGALVFLVMLALSFGLALAVRYLLLRALAGLDFDRRAELLGISADGWSTTRSPSALIAAVAYWIVLFVGVLLGLTALDAALPTRFAVSVLAYVPDVLAAILILVFGGIVARFLARAVLIGSVNMGLQHARVLSLAVKWLVLVVASAMALDHIGIGRTVLLLAFGIVFGGIVLAIALAVGLGARDAVSRAIERQLQEPAREDRVDHV